MIGIICRLAGIILVLVSAIYMAKEINGGMEKRCAELGRLYNLLLQLKSELQYMGEPLPECFSSLSGHSDKPFDSWLSYLAGEMKREQTNNFAVIWTEGLKLLEDNSHLESNDIEPLNELKDKLGSMDMEIQTRAIDYALLRMEECRKGLYDELKEKKKVVISVSLFIGILILIILV